MNGERERERERERDHNDFQRSVFSNPHWFCIKYTCPGRSDNFYFDMFESCITYTNSLQVNYTYVYCMKKKRYELPF